jgi:hypothetical protein
MNFESIIKINLAYQQLTYEEKVVNDKVAELAALRASVIEAIEKEFAARREKIQAEFVAKFPYDRDAVRQCYNFLEKIQEGEYVAVSKIPDWMEQIVQHDEKKEIEVPLAFNGVWSVEQFQQIKHSFLNLMATAKYCKATARAEGLRRGYKAKDTTLAIDELWENIQLSSEDVEMSKAKIEWFDQCEWTDCFDKECENIPESKWNWGHSHSEYVTATVTVPAIVFHIKDDDV